MKGSARAARSPRGRVLEVAPRYFPDLGGTETHVHEVSTRMPQERFSLTVFASDRSGRLPRAETADGFDIIRRQAWPRTKDYYFAPGLAPVITRGDWDLIHFQGIHTLIPIVGMLAARRAGIPYVLTFHTGGHSSSARNAGRDLQWKALTPLLRGAERLICVSRFERRLFVTATGIDPVKFTVIRNGGDLPAVSAGVQPVPGRLVSSGRLERYKGHHRAIELLPILRRDRGDAHLVILGAGPYEAELLDLARTLGVEAHVTIRHVPPGDRAAMARELTSAEVMVAFSDYEAHPVGVMEALALGVPVVGSDIAGIADLVEDGVVRGVAPDADATQAARVVLDVLTRGTSRRHDAAGLDLPTWQESADQLAAVYLAAMNRATPRESLSPAL